MLLSSSYGFDSTRFVIRFDLILDSIQFDLFVCLFDSFDEFVFVFVCVCVCVVFFTLTFAVLCLSFVYAVILLSFAGSFHFSHLLFQIFQIFSLDLKFSNLLFEIFKSSLSDHCIDIFENSLTPTVDSLKKIICIFRRHTTRWLQRIFFDITNFKSPKTTMNKIHNRRA